MAYDEPTPQGGRRPARRPPARRGGIAGALRGVAPPADTVGVLRGAMGLEGDQPGVNPFDFSTDPILQRIAALQTMRRQDAQAEATRLRSELDIEFGFGAAGDTNPFSVRAKLAEQEQKAPGKLDESLNPSNLFYSSTRDTRQADLSKSLLEARASAEGAYRKRGSDIEGGLRSALLNADEEDARAREDAAERLRERLGDLPVTAAARAQPGGIRAALRTIRPQPPRRPPQRRPGLREQ